MLDAMIPIGFNIMILEVISLIFLYGVKIDGFLLTLFEVASFDIWLLLLLILGKIVVFCLMDPLLNFKVLHRVTDAMK